METSPNVVSENLHNTRNLETTYYVTDMTQASDFYWDRESGLRVNIGILNVHLVPEYEDVDSESDNNYMLSIPNNIEDKTKFQNILHNFCRNPVPDYYSITLEISRDRTTTAQVVRCNSKDTSVPKCPPSYLDGELFLSRNLNDACQKMGTFPELLRAAANSIVCTQRTDLLEDLFGQVFNLEKPIRFPSKQCRMAISRCEQCLNQPHCVKIDLFERRCCQVDCYTLIDCKMAHSEECTSSPVECAMGDAYRFTIQPVFNSIRSEVQCHIARHPSEVIYELFFFLQLPDRNFQTPKVSRIIRPRDQEYQNRGIFSVDYLTVEHDTGLFLHDHLLLRRQELRHKLNYTILSMESGGYGRGAEPVRNLSYHEISNNIYVTSGQFESPFDFSTSSWIQENGCHKNVSRMRPLKKAEESARQEVSVIIQTSSEPFRYFLKSAETAPYFRFIVPGNMSILPYYFRHDGPVLLVDETLQVSLSLDEVEDVWLISVRGEMSSCPAYLGATIHDLFVSEEIFRYDYLILCPTNFSLEFRLPFIVDRPDVAFAVKFTDPRKTFDVSLSFMTIADAIDSPVPEPPALPGRAPVETLVHLALGLFVVLVLFFLVAYACLENERLSRERDRADLYRCRLRAKSVSFVVASAGKFTINRAKDSNSPPRSLAGVYMVLWSVYSVSFTVTVFFHLLSFIVRPEANQLAQLASLEAARTSATANLSAAIDDFRSKGILDQQRLVGDMRRACSNHVGTLYSTVASDVVGTLFNRTAASSSEHPSDDVPTAAATAAAAATISHLLEKRFRTRLQSYKDKVSNFSQEFRVKVTADIRQSMRNYRKYLSTIFWTEWLSFAQNVFNESNGFRQRILLGSFESLFSGNEVEFGMFLEIEEIEVIQLWSTQLWERYFSRMPVVPDLPKVVSQLTKELHCTSAHPVSSSSSSSSSLNSLLTTISQKYDSSRYHVSAGFTEEPTSKPPLKSPSSTFIIAEEHRNPTFADVISASPTNRKEEFHFDDVFDSSIIDLLQVVFLAVDTILLLYRATSIYMACSELFCGKETRTIPLPRGVRLTINGGGAPPGTGCRRREIDTAGLGDVRNKDLVRRLIFVGESSDQPISSSEEADSHGGSLAKQITQISGYSLKCPLPILKPRCDPVVRNDVTKAQGISASGSMLGKLLQNGALPRVIGCVFLLVLVYLGAISLMTLLDTSSVAELSIFGSYVDIIASRINQTNVYLEQEATLFNDVILSNCQFHASAELLNLESLIAHLKTEEHRMMDSFVSEACGGHRRGTHHDLNATNIACNFPAFAKPPFNISLMPCNFLPVLPHLYSELYTESFHRQLVRLIVPYVTAAQILVVKAACVVTMAAASVLLVHIVSFLLLFRVEIRRREHLLGSCATEVVSSPDSNAVKPLHSRLDSEDDENEVCLESYRMYQLRQVSSGLPVGGFTPELRYIETKV